MGQEIELKLEVPEDAARRIEAAGLFHGKPRRVRQHATYFDTPDLALRRSGLSLRIRREGGRLVQTVKTGGGGIGLFERGEWERDIADEMPVLDEETGSPLLPGGTAGSIAPLFVVRNDRTILSGEGEAIEAVLDRGMVVAGDRQAPYCELELEQKGGARAALFDLARKIGAVVPVRLGLLSKSERGYRLLGPLPVAARAEAVAVLPSMTVAAAFRAIILACIRQFRLNEMLILERDDRDALHQARVALRRLRSALSLLRASMADAPYARFSGESRWLTGELGRARDIDVLADRLADEELAQALLRHRRDAYAQVRRALDSPRARMLALDLVEWVSGDAGTELAGGAGALPVGDFAAALLDDLRSKVKKRGRHLADIDDEARHRLRKSAKKLRYAAEFFAGLYEGKEERRAKHFLSTLSALQDDLGALNDLATLPGLLAELGLEGQAEALLPARMRDKEKLLHKAAGAHAAFADAARFWRQDRD